VQDLPEEVLVFLLGSRYCETDLLSQTAWQLFGGMAPGYPRVQAICDYVHNRIFFNYQNARPTRSAAQLSTNEPAFAATTHISPSPLPLDEHSGAILHRLPRRCRNAASFPPGDFAAWFEAWIGGRCTYSTRATICRAAAHPDGARRDASDVAIATTFGPICWRVSGSGPTKFRSSLIVT